MGHGGVKNETSHSNFQLLNSYREHRTREQNVSDALLSNNQFVLYLSVLPVYRPMTLPVSNPTISSYSTDSGSNYLKTCVLFSQR